MAVGNTFGATALSSYGGFWISFAIILTPGGFQIVSSLEAADNGSLTAFHSSLSLFLWVCFFFLQLSVYLTYLGLVHFHHNLTCVYSEIDARLLPTLLHTGSGILVPRCLLHVREC